MPRLDLLAIEGQWVGFRAPWQSGIKGGMGGVLLLWDIRDEGAVPPAQSRCLEDPMLENTRWLLDVALEWLVPKYGTGKL